MRDGEFILLVVILALATALTRFLPFLIFGRRETPPAWVEYLGKVLPGAMMGLLVGYCFKDTDWACTGEVVPALLSALVVVGVHLAKRNTILSIALGTAAYMVLIRIL